MKLGKSRSKIENETNKFDSMMRALYKLCRHLPKCCHQHNIQTVGYVVSINRLTSLRIILQSVNPRGEQQRCFSNDTDREDVCWPSARRQAREMVYHGCKLVDYYSWMKTSGLTQVYQIIMVFGTGAPI